mmetsp:Transcript_97777/g.209767  ORF Transcript_97777/g.209767 Transcript_97777/m.209767 type:complete len:164 (+) Transcript_97777:84-575(+)
MIRRLAFRWKSGPLWMMPPKLRHCTSGAPLPSDRGKTGPMKGSQLLQVVGMGMSLEMLFGVTCAVGMAYFCLGSDSGGKESSASAAEAEQASKEAWRQQAAALKEFYDAQASEEKMDPPAGSDLARFALSNRRLYAMHFGLPRWKIQELEAIDGWQWQWKIKR